MAGGSGLTRGATSLTQRSIEALRPAETAYRISDQRCIGLAVRVAPSGIKTWDLAYRIRSSGKTRRLSLGRVCDVSLEKARDRANELTSAARTGRDLIAEEEERRAAAASRLTVEKLIELYVKRRVVGRLRTAKEIESRLKRALLSIMDRHAEDIRGEICANCSINVPTKELNEKRSVVAKPWARCSDGRYRKTS